MRDGRSKIPTALTIAGSDSGGGAGIQADLKTFTVHGVFGTTAITALTAQNTQGVAGIHAIPADFVRQQIDAVLRDIGADAVKTGMLANPEIIAAVTDGLREHAVEKVVVDPVFVATSGDLLIEDRARRILADRLLPLATIVTPNIPEAEALTGRHITSVEAMEAAAQTLVGLGAEACLVKGGHVPVGSDEPVALDVLYDGREVVHLSEPRLPAENTHGTGCQLAAAITANLATGLPLRDAVVRAKRFITQAIRHGLSIGRGRGPANAMAWRAGDS